MNGPNSPAVLVTGAASGIGRATAELLAQRGWRVLAVDRNGAGLAELDGDAIVPLELDLTRPDLTAQIPAAVESVGPLRGLVSSVGVELHGTIVDMVEADWDRVMAVNLKSIYLVCREALPLMARAGGGSVVHIGSVQGIATQPTVAAYAATKGAVISLTRAMALDHAPEGIRVNCVCPGTIDTPLVRANAAHFNPESPEQALREWASKHALGRLGTPREVATVVAFLLSDEASFVTGAAHIVDGGLLAAAV